MSFRTLFGTPTYLALVGDADETRKPTDRSAPSLNRLVDEEADQNSSRCRARILGHAVELYQAACITADATRLQSHRDSAMHRLINAAKAIVKEV